MTQTSKKAIIKTGFCVSYDWTMLRKSLTRVYPYADVICLALDKNRRSWAGNPYHFDNQAFYDFVKQQDTEQKIILIEEDFALTHLNSRENGNRHRMRIAEVMGKGGWHIQVDSDEYFLDFKKFTDFLRKINPNPTGNEKPLNVCANWISLIKKVNEGFLYVDFLNKMPENAPFASNAPQYERARHNGHFNVLSPFYVIHETWSRSDEELWFKINNWGHSSEELETRKSRESYYALWKALDRYNYQYIRDFHPASAPTWPALGFCPGQNIDEFIQNFETPAYPLSNWQLKLQNNRNVARVRALWAKIFKTQKP
ncbi:MAG: hypothetical protein NW226_15780 [Microscillaceae bacterium]|nr:hypothetical protein [Microscillaceae bacterium]